MLKQYFIEGNLRLALLLSEITIFVICIEIVVLLLINYLKSDKYSRDLRPLGFVILFLGYGFFIFFNILADFYSSQIESTHIMFWQSRSDRLFMMNIGNSILIAGIIIFISFMERYKVYFLRRYFFTIISDLMLPIYLIFFFIDLQLTQYLSIIFYWPIFVIFFSIYMANLTKLIDHKGNFILNYFKNISFFIVLFSGYFLSRDFLISIFGVELRLFGAFLQIIALLVLNNLFRQYLSFSKYEWQDQLEELYLISKSGICLFHRNFIKNQTSTSRDHLISSALSSINMILDDFAEQKKEKISIIEKEGNILTIYAGINVSAVIISKEEFEFINNHLRELVNRIEKLYSDFLENWKGDLSVFLPIENLVNEIFNLKKN